MSRARVLVLGGRPPLLRKAVECGLQIVNVQKPTGVTSELSEICDEVHVVDYQDVTAITSLADQLHAINPFVRVLSQTESAVLIAGHLTTRLGLPGNGVEACRTLQDKRWLRALLNRRGLGPVAVAAGRRHADLATFVTEHGAAVAKPAMASGSLGVRKVHSIDDVDAAWAWLSAAGIGEFMIEEMLVGPEISVETFSVGGVHHVVAYTGKDTGGGVVELGHVVPAPIPDADAAAAGELTVRMLDAVGVIDGPAHTEVILTDAGPRIIEAHCRRAGDRITDLVEYVHGVDLERLSFELVHGPVAIAPTLPRGASAIRFLTAVPGRIERITGVEDARASDGVVAVKIRADVGGLVGPLLWSEDRCGHVMTYAADVPTAVAQARAAADRIGIHTVPAPAGPTTITEMLAGVGEVLDPFDTATTSADLLSNRRG
jgi:biotin carboxylase